MEQTSNGKWIPVSKPVLKQEDLGHIEDDMQRCRYRYVIVKERLNWAGRPLYTLWRERVPGDAEFVELVQKARQELPGPIEKQWWPPVAPYREDDAEPKGRVLHGRDEIAAHFRIDNKTVTKYVKEGMPIARLGKQRRLCGDTTALRTWLREHNKPQK